MAFVVSNQRSQELATLAINVAMRGLVDGLRSPHPIVERLPAALQEDDFCRRMVSGLDDVLAPAFNTLDCFDSYLDPALAPDDFVDWLASWVGVDIDETWTIERRRQLIPNAVALYRMRGTAAGLAAHIRLYSGVAPEIEDSGGCAWSQTADGALPGSPEPRLTVRLRVEDENSVRRSTVSRIVDGARPAHVPYQVEIIAGGTALPGAEEAPSGDTAADAPGAVDLPGSEHIELAPQGPELAEEGEAEAEAPASRSAGDTGAATSEAVGADEGPPVKDKARADPPKRGVAGKEDSSDPPGDDSSDEDPTG